MSRIRRIPLLAALALAGIGTAARADYLLGVLDNGTGVIQIDPVTGHGVQIGSYGPRPDASEDIVRDASGNLVIVGYVSGINTGASLRTTFAKLDPVTFKPTVLATAFAYQ